MAGNLRFEIAVATKNAELLPELEGRLADLSPAFHAIIIEWARLNADKFAAAAGREAGGAEIDPLVYWEPLASSTRRAKRRQGQPDAIMVATGQLLRAMTNPDLMFQNVDAESAVFGSPLDPEDAAKVAYNWSSRQVVFLSTTDQNVIRRIIKDYLSMGPNFEEIRFARGLAIAEARRNMAAMDAEFSSVAGEVGVG